MSEVRAAGAGGWGWRGRVGSGARGEPQRNAKMAMCMGEAGPKANLLEGKKSCQPTPPAASADPTAYGEVDMLP